MLYRANRLISIQPVGCKEDRDIKILEESLIRWDPSRPDYIEVQLPGSDNWAAAELRGASLLLSSPWVTPTVEVPEEPVRVPLKAAPVPKPAPIPVVCPPEPPKAPEDPMGPGWKFDTKEKIWWCEEQGFIYFALAKGLRGDLGTRYRASKMTQELVDELRAYVAAHPGESYKSISKRYGITDAYVGQIVRYEKWKPKPCGPDKAGL